MYVSYSSVSLINTRFLLLFGRAQTNAPVFYAPFFFIVGHYFQSLPEKYCYQLLPNHEYYTLNSLIPYLTKNYGSTT